MNIQHKSRTQAWFLVFCTIILLFDHDFLPTTTLTTCATHQGGQKYNRKNNKTLRNKQLEFENEKSIQRTKMDQSLSWTRRNKEQLMESKTNTRVLSTSKTRTSEGDQAIMSDVARDVFGVNGTGQKICVLSDSFDCLGGAAQNVATGDLPSFDQIDIIQDLTPEQCEFKQQQQQEQGSTKYENSLDFGRAMMQIIHDIAPGATLGFQTTFLYGSDLRNAIVHLVDKDCTVIVDLAGNFGFESFFQQDVLSRAIEDVVTRGMVPYFTSAGSSDGGSAYDITSSTTWEGSTGFVNSSIPDMYEDNGQILFGGYFHRFLNGEIFQTITIPKPGNRTFKFRMQWDEPLFACTNDLDFYIVYNNTNGDNNTSTTGLQGSFKFNFDSIPFEEFDFTPVDLGFDEHEPMIVVDLYILQFGQGPPPNFIKIIVTDNVEFEIQNETKSGTIYGRKNSPHVATIGAAPYFATAPFGVNPPLIDPKSPRGGVPILFDVDGTRLDTPDIRQQPLVIGPTGVQNSFWGVKENSADNTSDHDNSTNEINDTFRTHDTATAAVHVASVAALMLQADENLEPNEIYDILAQTAIDMNDDPRITSNGLLFDVGFDFKTGFGFVNATAAIECVIALKKCTKHTSSPTIIPPSSQPPTATPYITSAVPTMPPVLAGLTGEPTPTSYSSRRRFVHHYSSWWNVVISFISSMFLGLILV